ALAGSTGSIGTQTLDVVEASHGRYEVVGLAASSNEKVLREQITKHRPRVVAVVDENVRKKLAGEFTHVQFVAKVEEIVADADVVVNAVVGFAGLPVTLETLRRGKRLALANKESLIAAGPVVQPLRGTPGAVIVPVDSEHCAVHQCLRASESSQRELATLILTASGGPFRGKTRDELAKVNVAEALKHPTWSMGPKITVDSSTLMNKGLEVIEAHELFGVSYDRIDVVVHPQSIIHSMVTFTDGATIAQLSLPDMRLPIAYAIAWPERFDVPFGSIDWRELRRLDFETPDRATFRCLDLAYTAGRTGGSAPAWLSAANEIAVDAFLSGRISWLQIAEVNDATLQRHDGQPLRSADDVLSADATARRIARSIVETFAQSAGTVTA
ncbi:MAG: 1-deoxy-D-xylulose-5-phosphate reductoisomerase, partial [Actinobacteria bacterium]|nr:1-deoxy-D-xylulose-5-phosphate reductoisomerase [Actinomycetota bacterium]